MTRNLSPAKLFPLALLLLPSLAAAAPIRIEATTADPGRAVLELQAEELVTMTAIPFRLLLSDAAGKPLTGARVSCDMIMPAMAMPANRPKVTEHAGAYSGELVFTCAMGAWRINCQAEHADGHRQAMHFDIATVRMK